MDTINKGSALIQKLYNYILFSAASLFFGYVTARMFFPSLDSKTIPLKGLAAIFMFIPGFLALWTIDRFIVRKMSNSAAIITTAALILANTALQIFCLYNLKVKPTWDFGAIVNAADDIASAQAIRNQKYFQTYPYNLYSAIYIGLFKMLVGGNRSAPYILNMISATASITGACLLSFRLRGRRAMAWTALFCLAVTALYLNIPIVYTDMLSMPFAVWTVYFATFPHSHSGIRKSILCSIFAGLLSALGFMIKQIAAIALAAIAVDCIAGGKTGAFGKARSKTNASVSLPGVIPALISIAIFVISIYSARLYIGNSGLLNEVDGNKKLPYTHWLMMGMNKAMPDGGTSYGYGGFSLEDLKYSRSFITTHMMKQADKAKIMERLTQFGIDGYMKFLLKKIEWTWTDGTYFVPMKLMRYPLRITVLHKFVLFSDGKCNTLYRIFSQFIQTVILSMMLAGCVFALIKDCGRAFRLMTLMCLGLAFFLLFWETRSRYLIFMIPVFIVMTVHGMQIVFGGLDKLLTSLQKKSS